MEKKKNTKNNIIRSFEEDPINWYTDIIFKAELMLYGPTKGTMYLRPYTISIWNLIIKWLTKEFSKNGVEEVKFPLIFPKSLLDKEKKHIEGFAPEILLITHIGNKKLTDFNVIRPTSEMLFSDYFKKTIKTYNQLPVKLNQWVNIMRWENNTRPFLRNSEFYWQEGHTVHNTEEEAKKFSILIHEIYKNFLNKILLLPIISGEKSTNERFAGAINTYTQETILKDGQALQVATSHYLGNEFAKSVNFKIQNKENKYFYPFQSSWGTSTRLIGGIIMTHSDNKGLVLPSKISPFQIVIIPIKNKNNDFNFDNFLNTIYSKINRNFRIKIDNSDNSFGYLIKNWEIKGVPIIIEIGAKEFSNSNLILKIRSESKKRIIDLKDLNAKMISNFLKEHDKKIKEIALNNFLNKKIWISSLEDLKKNIIIGNVVYCYWIEDSKLEDKIKKETGATIRLLYNEKKSAKSVNKEDITTQVAIFARSY
ncbi:/ proS / Proline--tRNA ligase /:70875 Forward [Candidatus Hepatoplasma crinochetorum]|uniref:Proline--tRNA ligase n=1 Tax=Candidatus Hepatoplasma crinochetorum TaxID=295596 RepID=A0A0G7ZLZ1_9MOLU|nr:/ proS / Proline--tRNA ligase /:70875 Forward [Candidatus Hepatoplasma crinochetorum]